MNPGTDLTTHIYKGRTGKTLISINLATVLAKHGKNVCLIDLDLRAPSLDATFVASGKNWTNDFLSDKCGPTNMLKETINQFKRAFKRLVVNLLPCYCDVLQQQRTTIMALDEPNHPFPKSLAEVVGKLDRGVD